MVMSINQTILFNYLYGQYKGYNQAVLTGRVGEYGMDYAFPRDVTN